jgi:hypothetical protein
MPGWKLSVKQAISYFTNYAITIFDKRRYCMRTKSWIFLTICFLLLASCNLPAANNAPTAANPEVPGVEAMGTAVELTTIAKLTALAGTTVATATNTPPSAPLTETPSPTPCTPLVTAVTTANIRSGPGTAYDAVGALPVGGTAKLAGRNDANTWWYIEFVGGVGGHAWISGTVTTATCLPSTVQIVAAPVLPTAQPVADTGSSGSTGDTGSSGDTSSPAAAGQPDLVANGMQFAPEPGQKDHAGSVQVRVTNNGSALASEFTVVWYANQDEAGCTWTVQGLGAGASKALSCPYTYTSARYPTASSNFSVWFKVDTGNQVAESNEGNNSSPLARWTVVH